MLLFVETIHGSFSVCALCRGVFAGRGFFLEEDQEIRMRRGGVMMIGGEEDQEDISVNKRRKT